MINAERFGAGRTEMQEAQLCFDKLNLMKVIVYGYWERLSIAYFFFF
jgi:hypothetical protein